jgi:hypothetical protein
VRAARGTRDVQVPGVENLGYLVGGLAASEDVRGGLGSVPGFPAFDGTASSGLQGIGALVRQSLTRSRCRPSHARAGPGARRTRYSDVPCGHCDALPASLAHKAAKTAKTATARLWPRSRGRRARRQGRGGVGGATGRSKGKVKVFPMQSALLRLELSIPVPFSAQFSTRRCGCDYRPSQRLSPPGCRLSHAFMRCLQPRAATLTWPRVHATAGRQGLAGLVESVQVNVRRRGTDRK